VIAQNHSEGTNENPWIAVHTESELSGYAAVSSSSASDQSSSSFQTSHRFFLAGREASRNKAKSGTPINEKILLKSSYCPGKESNMNFLSGSVALT